MSQFCCLDQSCQFDLPVRSQAISQRTGMEFNEFCAEVRRSRNLSLFRIDE